MIPETTWLFSTVTLESGSFSTFTLEDLPCILTRTQTEFPYLLVFSSTVTLEFTIAALCAPLDARKHIQAGAVVCGCVDNHHARREIARANCIWIDAGNEYDHGQAVIGNAGEWDTVWTGLDRARDNVCSVLPHAGLLFPALLEPEPDKIEPELSCAELATRGDQHLYINDFMGNLVTQYVYQLLNREPITTFATFATLTPCVSIRAIPFTRENLSVYHST